MTESKFALVGTSGFVRLGDLELDPENPRLVTSKGGESQMDLAINLEMAHESIVVAQSIARHGFFANEPLIVLPKNAKGKHRIVEGNRRFVALTGLANAQMRGEFFEKAKWDALASECDISMESSIPVSTVQTREEASSIMGFRHISGILDWSPYAQASFVADLVDAQGYTFEQVAPMIGKKRQDVAEMYRNVSIAKQSTEMGIEVKRLEDAFSLLTVAMGSPHIREFVGATSGVKTTPGIKPIPEEKHEELQEVITWIFGDDTPNSRKVEESRKISALGKVIGNPIGLKALRDGSSLDVAQAAIAEKGMDPKERILKRLETALNALKAASNDMDTCSSEPDVASLLEEIAEEINGLNALTELID
ncbi:hypothetical protein OAD85_03050 [Actinomycetota bacterium]|nr:hypothetical protein [Actinomycetota bacterium]